MTKSEIIGMMAKSKMVEKSIMNMTHQHLEYDLQDLSQMIYLALMEQPEERVQDLWANDEMQFFVLGIIRKQVFSQTSPYYITIKKFNAITDDICDHLEFDERVIPAAKILNREV